MEKIKLLSLFSGIGAFEKALQKLKVDYELVNFCEFDKYAVKSYCAIHGVDESKNLGDITKVDPGTLQRDINLITYGFPCQDISLAGKQKGFLNSDGSLTRSGLFFKALDIIKSVQPKYAIAENVKNLTGKKFSEQFKIVLNSLNEAGYNNYWKVLNAKDFGIPQNRERVFIISIRKDIDNGLFEFPQPVELELRLKDLLEDVVDEKFYINDYMALDIVNDFQINLRGGKWEKIYQSARRVYSEDYIAPTLPTCQGGNIESKVFKTVNPLGKVMIPQATKQGYAECEIGGVADLSFPNSKTRRGRVQEGGNICPTITTESNGLCRIENSKTFVNGDICKTVRSGGHGSVDRHSWDMVAVKPDYRIRKLTPKECFRLMGFDDADFQKAEVVNSNTQLYKQAGNSIVVNCLTAIFSQLIKAENGEGERKAKTEDDYEQISFLGVESMKANYDDTKHSKIKKDVYNSSAELFFSAIVYFLADKQGWSSKRIYQALDYIQGLIRDLNSGEVDFQDIRDDLSDNYGIIIMKSHNGIRIRLDEEVHNG